jgi:hypothetical protein
MTQALTQIGAQVRTLSYGANIRIEAHHDSPVLASLSAIKDTWPLFNWTSIARGKEIKAQQAMVDHKNKYVPIVLNRQTIAPLLMERLRALSLNEPIMEKATLALDEVLRL